MLDTATTEQPIDGNTEQKRERRPRVNRTSPESPSPAAQSGTRLSFALTEDGKIDFSRMAPETREKVRKAVADPDLPAKLGMDPMTGPASSAFGETTFAAVYDMAGKVLAGLAVKRGADPKAAAVLMFSDEEKAALAGPTAKVVNKYVGPSLGKYEDEIALALVLTMVMSAKMDALKKAVELTKAQRPAPVVVDWPTSPAPENMTS